MERPIIFSAPMVRAIMAGEKTQTRRMLRPQPAEDIGLWLAEGRRPVWQVHDLLWVKETFIGARAYDDQSPKDWGNKPIWYCADGEPTPAELWWFLSERRRPSIYLPRWASRLTLRITDVSVQRLLDITEADAEAEGAPKCVIDEEGLFYEDTTRGTHRTGFAGLWSHIHGPDAWDSNPWVAAITFERAL